MTFYGLFSFCLFALCNSDTFALFYFILFSYYYHSEACLFSNERGKGSGSGQEECGEQVGEAEEGETMSRIYYVREKITILNRRQKEEFWLIKSTGDLPGYDFKNDTAYFPQTPVFYSHFHFTSPTTT